MKKYNHNLFLPSTLALLMIFVAGCGGGSSRYMEEGLDTVIKQYRETPTYTILLYDQNYEGGKYQHQYQVLIPTSDSSLETVETPFYQVSDRFFNANVDHLGMEMANKKDGKLSKSVAPAGYSQYVGNEKYGRWVNRDGGRFWEFYGRYAFMSTMFNMGSSPARYGYYQDYRRNYAPAGRTYRGPNNYYGTQSYMSSNKGRTTSWNNKPSSFRNDVRSRVKRSSTASTKSKVSRSSNRYSSKSSSRSRSGGYGK